MRQSLSWASVSVATLFLTVTACGGSKTPSPSPESAKRPSESSPLDSQSAKLDAETAAQNAVATTPIAEEVIAINDVDVGPDVDGPLFEATYGFTVIADMLGGVNVCQGDLNLVVNKDFSISQPKSKISCLGGLCDLDLEATLKALQGSSKSSIKDNIKGLASDKKFLSVSKIGKYEFTPPRPLMLLSPFHFDPIEDAIKVDETYQGSLKDTVSGVTTSGTLRLKVEEATQDRIRWSMTSTGWDGVRKTRAAIPERLDMTWSLNPIGMPHIGMFTVMSEVLVPRSQLDPSMPPPDLTKLCVGSSTSTLNSLTGLLPESGIFSGFTDSLIEFGNSLVGDVLVGITLNLKSQKLLGKIQERDP